MTENDKAELDRAINLLVEARDIIESVKMNQKKLKPYKTLEYALDKIGDAELDIEDAKIDIDQGE